jgi:hypothetical protein
VVPVLVIGVVPVLTGGGAVLLNAAHQPAALIVLGAFGIFAAALTLIDRTIDLAGKTGDDRDTCETGNELIFVGV